MRLLIFLLILLTYGCGGKSLTKENVQKVKLEMSLQEVSNILGSPDKRINHPTDPIKGFYYEDDKAIVMFYQDKVTSVQFDGETLVEKTSEEILGIEEGEEEEN